MRDTFEYVLFSILHRLAQRLSFRSAERIGAVLGELVFACTPIRKRVTLENLAHAFPKKSSDELRRIARGAYRNYGIAVLQFMWSTNKSAEVLKPLVRFTNAAVLHQALERKRGVLFLSAHFGAWELLPASITLHVGATVSALVQRQRNPKIDALLDAHRRRFGNDTIPMGVSSRRVLTALSDNHVVILLGDQSGPKEAVFVDFFGRPAATHRGVAAFSLKSGAPIVMGFLVRQRDATYTLTLEEVDRTDLTAYTEENILELTRRHVAILERWIRDYPDHWLWMHKRWKHTSYYQQHLAETEQT